VSGRSGLVAAALVCAIALAGCGGGGGGGKASLTVSAATSLKTALTAYGQTVPGLELRYSFAGSDQLAAQIRAGARPDVFAAANTKLPQALFAAGLVERPVVFASNRLVLAVPASSSSVRSLADLARPGTTVVTGSSSVPVGSYTTQLLDRLPAAQRRRILANVRSREPDVAGIVGKLSQGAADAGFVYATDVRAAGGRLRAIELPARLLPRVAYAAAVVRRTGHRVDAQRFVRGLLAGAGQAALRAAGFTPPPPSP
jgi:molybdate transport system substrate-binding protein